MENKRTGIIIAAVAVILFVGVTFIFMYKPIKNKLTPQREPTAIQKEYEALQTQFAMDLPCGVTDFDSPHVTPVECDADKMKSGEVKKITFSVNVADEDGNGLENVRVAVNGGVPFFTDALGFLDMKIGVDSNKKVINLVIDKEGYSPMRRVLNAEVIDGNSILIPETFRANVVMREIDIQNVQLRGDSEIVVESKKYPGVSVTIPANGLENSKGEIVTGEVVGEITYLDPSKPEDRLLTPGFNGNVMQMVGVDHNGNQVLIKSQGMVFFHFKETGSDEILQPRKGTTLVITQPIPDEEYAILTDKKIQEKDIFTDEDIKYFENLGITANTSDDELFEIALENDLIVFNYWYFNERTGLWEEWPVKKFEEDIPNKLYKMEVPRFY